MKSRPSLGEKLAFAVGDGGLNFVWTTIGSFLTLYYTDNVGIAAATVGTIMLFARLADGVSDIVMGNIIDHTHTKWGKARPWLLWAALPLSISLFLLFNVPTSLSMTGKIVYAAVTYTVLAAGFYTACGLAYNALLSQVSSEPKDRIFMSSMRFFCTMTVVLFINYNTQKIVGNVGWSGMAAIYGLIAVVLLMITFFGTRERNNKDLQNDAEGKVQKKESLPTKEAFSLLFKNKYFPRVALIFIANYTALGINNGLRIFYARDVLGNAKLMGTLTLCFILPKLIGNLLYPHLVKYTGNWRAMMGGYVIQVIGLGLMAVMPASVPVAYAGLILTGIGGIPHNGGLFALVADVVDYGEWKTGTRLDGLTNSSTSFGTKVGSGLGSAIVGWGLAFAAYNGKVTVQTASTIAGIKNCYTILPIFILAIGFVALLFSNLDKNATTVQAELKERRISNNV